MTEISFTETKTTLHATDTKANIEILMDILKKLQEEYANVQNLIDNIRATCAHTWAEDSSPHWSGYNCITCLKISGCIASICYTPSNCQCPNMLLPSQIKAKEELELQKARELCEKNDHPIEYDFDSCSCGKMVIKEVVEERTGY